MMENQLNDILSNLYREPSSSQIRMSGLFDQRAEEDRSQLEQLVDYFKKQKEVPGFKQPDLGV